MTDKYVSVSVAASVQIAEMRDTAMRNIEISTMKYSSDWAEVAQLLDWLCGEIATAPEPASAEPVAEVIHNVVGVDIAWIHLPSEGKRPPVGTKLYAHPPAQQWIKYNELTTVDALQHLRDRGLVEQPVMSGLYKITVDAFYKPQTPEWLDIPDFLQRDK